MPNPFGAPEISVETIQTKLETDESFVWLDVREPYELDRVKVVDSRIVLLPLSRLAAQQLDAVPDALQDKETEVIVFCHHGMRSLQVAQILENAGFQRIINLAGGIDAWAREVDPNMPTY